MSLSHAEPEAPVLVRAADAATRSGDPRGVITLRADSDRTGGWYYRLVDRVARGEAAPQDIAASRERFDNHYVDSPLWRDTLARRAARA